MKAQKAAPLKKGSPTRRKSSSGSRKSRVPKLKRILVPIDFSEFATAALNYAKPIAQSFDARLELVYADETNYSEIATFGPVDVDLLRVQYADESKSQLKEIVKQVRDSGLKCGGTIRQGRAHHVITELAEEKRIDLIIIATHGHTGLEHLLLGSTAENVVRHAHCPVLCVRGPK